MPVKEIGERGNQPKSTYIKGNVSGSKKNGNNNNNNSREQFFGREFFRENLNGIFLIKYFLAKSSPAS
jgi:hypothetical protein